MYKGWLGTAGLFVALCASAQAQTSSTTQGEIWGALKSPAMGQTEAIGGYAAGCLKGAQALPLEGEGYQVLRPQRQRNYGHPDVIEFVTTLGQKAKAQGFGPILVGDMSQARGGPMAYGHGSHQTGLDVDIWFRLDSRPLKDSQLLDPIPVSMVKGKTLNHSTFKAEHLKMLKMAALEERVDRIFVNPPIKEFACRSEKGDRAWLQKLRPWWGHDEHFHVRLSCPADSPACVPQAPLGEGDGCGPELKSWLKSSTLLPKGPPKPNTRKVDLPVLCHDVRHAPGLMNVGGSQQ